MLSERMIQSVEQNWRQIAESAIQTLRRANRAPAYEQLDDADLRGRAEDLLSNLSYWLRRRDDEQLRERYERLGRQRCVEGVPLHEMVDKLQFLKRAVLRFSRDHHLEMTAVELYSEQELLVLVDEFFDQIVYRIVKGYAEALVKARQTAAA